MKWKIVSHKLYRTCLEEEKFKNEQNLLRNEDRDLENSEFCNVLNDNITKKDISQYEMKNFHYAYICQKPEIEDMKNEKDE